MNPLPEYRDYSLLQAVPIFGRFGEVISRVLVLTTVSDCQETDSNLKMVCPHLFILSCDLKATSRC